MNLAVIKGKVFTYKGFAYANAPSSINTRINNKVIIDEMREGKRNSLGLTIKK